jgi:hypothetical protein
MPTKPIILGSILIFFCLMGGATQVNALSMCVDSKELVIQQDECVRRATAVIRKYFKETRPYAEGVVYGFQGENGAAILCNATNKGVVFFATSGPDTKVCSRNKDSLLGGF